MQELIFRPVTDRDIPVLTGIYNSNPAFLRTHLGVERVEEEFLREEMAEMKRMGFLSRIIVAEDRRPVGLADYRPGESCYLSLLMLDASHQGNGLGRRCYALLERELVTRGCRTVRLDAVQGPHSPAPFWEKLGFAGQEIVSLTWGGKTSPALVMRKMLPLAVNTD